MDLDVLDCCHLTSLALDRRDRLECMRAGLLEGVSECCQRELKGLYRSVLRVVRVVIAVSLPLSMCCCMCFLYVGRTTHWSDI